MSLEVADSSGNAILDLRREELGLKVDGREVRIESLSLLHRAPPLEQAAMAADGDLGQHEVAEPRPREGGYTAFLVDEGDTPVIDRRAVIEQLESLVADAGSAGESFMVARFDGGQTSILAPWTRNAAEIGGALALLRRKPTLPRIGVGRGGGVFLEHVRERFRKSVLEVIATFPRWALRKRLVLCVGDSTIGFLETEPEELFGVETEFRAPAGNASRVAGVQGRADRNAFSLWSRAMQTGRDSLSADDLVAKANECDIALVPIATVAFDRNTNPGVDSSSPARPSAGDGQLTLRSSMIGGLQGLAQATGGQALLVPRKALRALGSLRDGPIYTLSFLDPFRDDHQDHRIVLHTGRPGARLRYRRSYRIPTPEERNLDRAEAALLRGVTEPQTFQFRVVLRSKSRKGKAITRVQLKFVPAIEPDGESHRAVSVLAVGLGRDGQRTEPIQWSGEAYASGNSEYEAEFDLGVPRDKYRWSFVLTDQELDVSALSIGDF